MHPQTDNNMAESESNSSDCEGGLNLGNQRGSSLRGRRVYRVTFLVNSEGVVSLFVCMYACRNVCLCARVRVYAFIE
jgi:hypothetical protein